MNAITDNKIVRYLFSGIVAALANIFLIYFFADIVGLWYLASSVMAFLGSLFVSFAMQKYVTFKDSSSGGTKEQLVYYLILSLVNLSLNTLTVYVLVDFLDVNYIYSQIISAGVIAIESFFVYNLFIFKKTP